MGVPLNLKDIQSGFLSADTHTANNTLIEEALAKTLNRVSNSTDNVMKVDLDMGLNQIFNVSTNVDKGTSLLSVADADNRYLNSDGDTARGNLDMGGFSITNLKIPHNANDAARLADVGPDSAAALRLELGSSSSGEGASLVTMQDGDTVETAVENNTTDIEANKSDILSRVVSVDNITDLENYNDPIDQQQFNVIDVGLFYYDSASSSFIPQSIVVTRGTTFPDNPYNNQLFLVEPSSLYFYNQDTTSWVLVVDPAILEGYVAEAELARDEAQSARDAAIASSNGIYADTAAGLADTVVGDYFSVISPDDVKFIDLYKHDTGPVATFIDSYPSSQALDFVTESFRESIAFAITDEEGASPFFINNDGRAVSSSSRIGKADIDYKENPLFSFLLSDSANNSALGVRFDGTVVVKKLSVTDIDNVSSINGSPVNEGTQAASEETRPTGFTSEINGISSYGQSLSVGSTSTPVISTAQKYDNLMFNSGVRTQDGGTDPSVIYSSLVPLVESESSGLGETPVSGTTDHIKELIKEENGLDFSDMSYQFLGTAPGQGGRNITQLDKQSVYFARLMENIEYGALRAADNNKSYAYQATTWMQGESDYSTETPKETYKLKLKDLVKAISAESKELTKQTFSPIFITYQVGSHLRYAKSVGIASAFDADIAQAQLESSVEEPNIYLACPMYPFDYSGSVEQVHLTAADEKAVGAYFGLVYKRVVIDGEDWEPLKPEAITRSGNSVYIKMKVPKPPLTIDTSFVALNKDYGFRVFDGSGTQVTINNVSIVNQDSIKLELASTPSGNLEVDYAMFSDDSVGETGRLVGARGNIRDSQGDSIVFDPSGINRPMHNWLVMFKYKEGETTWL